MKLDRRTLLIGGGAGIGLIVAYAVWPRSVGSALQPEKGEQIFGHYVKIGTDGRVTMAVPQVETGQGAWTALPQILADELGASWEQVAVEPSPAASVYGNPLWKQLRPFGIDRAERVTAGATSIRAFEQPLRAAGAAAREMLCAAAAKRWGVAAAECDTQDGAVAHEGKRLRFAEVAEDAAGMSSPDTPTLRPPGTGKLYGRSAPRLDLPPKSDGSLRFAGDVRLPDMLYGAAALVPPGGRLEDRAQGLPGILVGEGWIAAIAGTSWAAAERLKKAAPMISGPSNTDNASVEQILRGALARGDAETLFERGDPDGARGRKVEASYSIAAAPHLSLEPLTATARIRDGRLEVWAGTQAPDRTRAAAAKAAGVDLQDTLLYPMPVGGPDGRALSADAAPVAAALAKRLRRPVQLIVPPGQTRRSDLVRCPAIADLRAVLGPDNRPLSWSEHFASSQSGGSDFPYAVPSVRIERSSPALQLATGYMRGGAEPVLAFVRESFLDELARLSGAEALSFRISLLSGQPRLARVLSAAAALGGWDGGGPGSSMGLACVSAFDSHIALLATASIGPDQKVRAERLVAAVDCGRAVNPGLVRQQVESGLLSGLAKATASALRVRAGLIDEGFPLPPRLAGTPEIVVEVVNSKADPGGVSGLGDSVVAPAVANAIASATGKRLRSLPFDPMSAA